MTFPIVIGDLTFRTKQAAKAFYRGIRDRYADNARVEDEDDAAVRDLLASHPEAKDKIGTGVSYFTVATETVFRRTRHFVVHRPDGSFTDFSFHACIDGRNDRRDRLGALRQAVEEQIIEFRERCFAGTGMLQCPLRGVPITRESYHIDHAPPGCFQVLVDTWLARHGLDVSGVQITPPGDNQIVAQMTDPRQVASWTDFHLSWAKLRILSPRANLSEAKRS